MVVSLIRNFCSLFRLNGSWDQLPHISSDISAEKEGISLPDMAPRKTTLKKVTKPLFDKRTQLTTIQMQKTIRDPSSLLRPVFRALPREFMEKKMRYETVNDFFTLPTSENYPPTLSNIFTRATSIKVIQSLPGERMLLFSL